METEYLEAQLYANPDDRDALLVYADHLARSGDPRGHLIALCARLETDATDARAAADLSRLVQAHDLFGPLGGLWRHRRVRHRYGFVRRIRLNLDELTSPRIAELLEHPAARFATTLELVGSGSIAWALDLAASIARPRALRELILRGDVFAPELSVLRDPFPYLTTIEVG